MTFYTQEELKVLISCPKLIIEPPRREMRLERGSRRNDMKLNSSDGDKSFVVFMRINEDFTEKFSIGLDFYPIDIRGSICLLRCNGPHGDVVGIMNSSDSHFHYHIHKAKPENIERDLRAERGGEVTDAYASYTQALYCFLSVINVVNFQKFYPDLSQQEFSFEEEEKDNGLS